MSEGLAKSGIHIKPENKGKFTEWAKRHGHDGVTGAAIKEGLASKNAHVRQMANFARNAKSWSKGD